MNTFNTMEHDLSPIRFRLRLPVHADGKGLFQKAEEGMEVESPGFPKLSLGQKKFDTPEVKKKISMLSDTSR